MESGKLIISAINESIYHGGREQRVSFPGSDTSLERIIHSRPYLNGIVTHHAAAAECHGTTDDGDRWRILVS